MKKTKIEEAPNCEINKKGEIYMNNVKCEESKEGVVILEYENNGVKYSTPLVIKDLLAKYFPAKTSSRHPERYEQIKTLLSQGKTRKEIKIELGIPSISSYIKKIKNENEKK